MHGAHRALDAGVHGLQHIQRFGAAALADDDAVGPHTQRGADQLALVDAALFVQIGRAGFELHHVPLLQLQFGGVFNGDDALVFGDEARQRVQRGRFAGTGSARDQDGGLRLDARRQKFQHAGRQRLVGDHLVGGDDVAAEAADAERWAVERQRRNDGVDARSVEQARIDDGLRFIDTPAHLRNDLLDDVQQVRISFRRAASPSSRPWPPAMTAPIWNRSGCSLRPASEKTDWAICPR